MTEEQRGDDAAVQDQAEGQTPADDARFEVKWKKKGGSSSPPTAEAAPAPQVGEGASLQAELEAERKRVAELQDRWHRAAADLANLRRRTEQEREDMAKFASMLLVQQILPVLDNFDRALATIPGNLQMLTWIQGVMLIERHLRAILEQQGLEQIEAQGSPFDPHYHEAIQERETDEVAPGTVVQELQAGYLMHGRVIRPALVEVATAVRRSEPAEVDAAETSTARAEEIAEMAESENAGP